MGLWMLPIRYLMRLLAIEFESFFGLKCPSKAHRALYGEATLHI